MIRNNGSNDGIDRQSSRNSMAKSSTDGSTIITNHPLDEGCIVLGKNGPPGCQTYVTRYRIHRKEQRSEVKSDVFHEVCCPCVDGEEEEPRSCKRKLWVFISSEPFIFFLHCAVIGFGVSKEALDLRTVDEELHLIHSLLETLATLIEIGVLLSLVWEKQSRIAREGVSIEHRDDGDTQHVMGRHFRRQLVTFTVVGSLMAALAVALFLVFYFTLHLGWTILSNNFCLLVTSMSSKIILERLAMMQATLSRDHHKAVIHEAVLLFAEMGSAKTDRQRAVANAKVETFCKALQDTDDFRRPQYISCHDDLKPDVMVTMQMQTMV